jgi:N-acetyl-alpha-D-muramate 1-phosphate uridylyltransferase
MLQVVVLAGGFGTRMRPYTERLPKALLPVCGRPFVDWQLAWLRQQGVRHVTFCVGHLAEALVAHVQGGAGRQLTIDFVHDGDRPLGTGGALRRALDSGCLGERFFVLFGDSYLRVRLDDVERAWQSSGKPAIMTVLRNAGRWDTSNVMYAKGVVELYDKSRADVMGERMHWIDYGLSGLSRDVVRRRISAGGPADLGDLMNALSKEKELAGYPVRSRFYEVGSPQGLRDLERFLCRSDAAGGVARATG